jgi:putative peptidoglycan lipid II flippase
MAMGTLSSRVLGLLRDILMAASFSVMITDAWLVAYRIPNLFRRLFGEGALSVSFIPLLVEAKNTKGEETERLLIRGVFSLLFSLLFLFSVLCMIFAPEIVGFIAGGEAFSSIAGKTAYTVKFLRIMSFFMLFICMFAFFMALLNSRKKFFAAAFAPVLLNLCLIAACFLPETYLPVPGEWLSWMALLGGFLQMAVLIPAVLKMGLLPKFSFQMFNPEVIRVLKNSTPAILSMGVLQITTMVNVYFASSIENGANSWIYYADRLLELPLSLIAVSFATALLPSLAEHWSQSNLNKFSEEFQKQLQFTLFLAIPAGIGLFILSDPLIEMFFQRGKFTEYSSVQTASILEIYAFSLILYASIRIINVCFYASQKVWRPIIGTSIGLIAHVIMVSYWVDSMGVRGLAISTALSGFINLCVQAFMYKKDIGGFSLGPFVNSLGKFVFAGGVMGVFLPLHFRLVETLQLQGWVKHSSLMAVIVLGGLLYFGVAFFLKCDELGVLRRRFRR